MNFDYAIFIFSHSNRLFGFNCIAISAWSKLSEAIDIIIEKSAQVRFNSIKMMMLTMSVVVFSHKSRAFRTFIYLSGIFNYHKIEKETKHPGLSVTEQYQNEMSWITNGTKEDFFHFYFHSFLIFTKRLRPSRLLISEAVRIITDYTTSSWIVFCSISFVFFSLIACHGTTGARNK